MAPGALIVAESYPTSEVRGSGLECQAATAQERPRGATPRPRPGTAARRSYPASEVKGKGRDEPPGVGSQGRCPRPGAVAGRSNRTPKARGGGREEQPYIQGVMAVRAQEGLEELSHVEGQEGRL